MIKPNFAKALPLLIAAALSITVLGLRARGEESAEDKGASLYRTHCASCHGIGGKGDGPVASSLKVEVPDLTRIAARHGGQFPEEQIQKIIDGRTTRPPHGPRDMPVWGDVFRSGDQVALLTAYLRSIQR